LRKEALAAKYASRKVYIKENDGYTLKAFLKTRNIEFGFDLWYNFDH